MATSADIEDQTEDLPDLCERRHSDVPSYGFDPSTDTDDVLTLCCGVRLQTMAPLFAGGTVVIAILGLAVAGLPSMTAAGVATSVVVAVMVVASATLLPALLGLAGERLNRSRSGWSQRRRQPLG